MVNMKIKNIRNEVAIIGSEKKFGKMWL